MEMLSNETRCSIYSAIRDTYHRCFNREWWTYRVSMLRFYSQFIAPADLVFDVGANVGLYSETFLRLGARVVAVEPNPKCIAQIKRLQPSKQLVIERAAVGNAVGEGVLYLCDDCDAHSTLSTEWMSVAHGVPRLTTKKWSQTAATPITTLHRLAEQYGRPVFIKIDVEGFEREALAGLSQLPRHLSFEFISEFADAAIACVRASCFMRDSRFNFVTDPRAGAPGGPYRDFNFALPGWVTAEEIADVLTSSGLRQSETFGDVFVRNAADPQLTIGRARHERTQ
jgi:FkbM family methyltransferase